MGPKPVKNDFFQKWPQTLWEGQTDLSGPIWARFDQFHGYTGYRILDTGTPGKGQVEGEGGLNESYLFRGCRKGLEAFL